MVPIGLLHSPEIVTQQVKFAPGAYFGLAQPSGLPGLDGRVRPARPLRHRLLVADVQRRQSFYETGANTFIVKNETRMPTRSTP